MTPSAHSAATLSNRDRRFLFWACFTAIAATAAVFAVRGQVIGDWAAQFGLTETQKGEILGVGLWPFAAAIVAVSMVADRIGYGKCMAFAFACHIGSTVVLVLAKNYWWLYAGTFLVSVGNGAAQAVADPIVASMYRHNRTTWLNILHASWPAGMLAGGIGGIALGGAGSLDWRWRIAMLLVPMALYGFLMLGRHFPVHERIEAGVSDREMFRETGGIGLFLVLVFLFSEFARLAALPWWVAFAAALLCSAIAGLALRSAGRPVFIALLVLMIPLATTELGTDSWITSLMERPMQALALNAGWVLVYTSFLMMILRFCAAPVVRTLTPLGVLIASCVFAAIGLMALSRATGLGILAAATVYGVGKTYLWPTMLGIVAERFPKGGALALNSVSAIGMMSVGIVGTVFLGLLQDRAVSTQLQRENPALFAQVVTHKDSVFGDYTAVDAARVATLPVLERAALGDYSAAASRTALAQTAILPLTMLLGYLALLWHLRGRRATNSVAREPAPAATT